MKRTARSLPTILIIVLFFAVIGCKREEPKTAQPVEAEQPRPLSQPLKAAVAGQVEVRFRPDAVRREFTPDPKQKGLERLNLSEQDLQVLKELELVQVRRVNPRFEWKESGRVLVLSDAEFRSRLGKKPRSARGTKAFEGVERDMILRFPPRLHPDIICEKLRTLPSVEKCAPSYKPRQLDPVYPNDPAFSGGNQWGFNNPAAGGPAQAPNFDIDAPEAWELQMGSASVVIAVIDTDVDVRHRDLYEKIWINTNELPADFVTQANALSSDEWPAILTFIDINAFSAPAGTQTAMAALRTSFGLTDANGNTYIDGEDLHNAFADGVDDDPPATAGQVDDIAGWDFTDSDGLPFSLNGHGTAVAGLAGAMTNNAVDIAGVGWKTRIMAIRYGSPAYTPLEYAISHGAQVLTSSLDNFGDRAEVAAVLETLEDEEVVFSASLGNVDKYISGTLYAESPYTIAVSNFSSTGVRALGDASSYSVNTDVAGPGNGTYSLDIPDGTRWFGGTSGANPIIAGILSLMIAERSGLSPEQLRQALRATAVDVPAVTGDQGENTPGYDYFSGWGLANAKNAVEQIPTNPWGEARLTTQPVTYYSSNRRESFHVIGATSEVRVFAGAPAETHSCVLERAPGPPPVPAGTWTTVVSGDRPYLKDEPLATLIRNDLPTGITTTRLTVTVGSRTFVDYGRVDVPHAYMNLLDNTLITRDFEIRGLAFHPDFARYELQVASGHDPDEGNDALWTAVGASVAAQKPPVASGEYFLDQSLFASVPLAGLPDGEATLRLAVFNGGGSRIAGFSVPILVDKTVFPFQSGFPAAMGWPYRYGGAVAYDLNGDGNLELIVTEQVNVHAFESDGTELAGWPANVGSLLITCSPAVGDVNGDGLPEVVVRASDYDTYRDTIYVFKNTGEQMAPWPLDPSTLIWSWQTPRVDMSPVLADLDSDGDLEILIAGRPASGAGAVRVFQEDGGLWHSYGPPDATDVRLPPAVGDLDADGQLDLVVVTQNPDGPRLSIWRADGSPLAASSILLAPAPDAGVVLADLDADRDLEIVFLNTQKTLRAFHHDGSPVAGWGGITIPGSLAARTSALSAGDFLPDDGSPTPQIIVSSYEPEGDGYRYELTLVRPDGTIPPEWSGRDVAADQTLQQPTVFDVDNDGRMEVLIGPYKQPDDATFAPVYAFNHDATPVADNRFPIYLGGEVPRAPAIADFDRDGDLEYGVASQVWGGPAEVFDLDALDDAGAVAWGMQFHDPQRTSDYHGGIRILEPTTTRPSAVGPCADASARHMLLVRLRQELPHGAVASAGLSVSINGRPAPVADFTRVEGEFWVLVAPPDQDAQGNYRLDVEWNDGGIRRIARQKDAVQYTADMTPVDQVLVMDRSGSMLDYDKYLASRTAANFYISARGAEDQAGVVSFFTEAADAIPGMLLLGPDGSTNRGSLAATISSITPPGPWARTSIGMGLRTALQDVLPGAQPDRERALALLSDGLENEPPFWDMGADPVRELFELPENSDIVIHTIALGPDADRDLHEAIAAATGGTPRFVYLGSSLSLFGRLADAYKQVEEIIRGEQRIFTTGADLPPQTTQTYDVKVPRGASRVSFAISYRDPDAEVRLVVLRPDGTEVEAAELRTFRGPSSRVASLSTPVPGTYRMQLTPLKGGTEVLSTAAVTVQKELFASLAWVVPEGMDSMAGTILAGVTDFEKGGLLRNSSPSLGETIGVVTHVPVQTHVQMKLRITAPDKSVTEIPLLDDGMNRDGKGLDGVHAAHYTFTQGGGYALTIIATVGAEASAEVLEKTIGYFQPRHRDRDLDGIVDAWELARFPGLSVESVHPLFDHDADGLNAVEESRYRTDPKNYDTDGDGRSDGYEVDHKTDPLKPDPRQTGEGDLDGDGIPDEWERKHFPGKDPSQVDAGADPDGDGLSNFTESRIGTNPARGDSDGDGIPDDAEYSWETPKPSDRVWHPQPEGPTQKPNRLLILILVVLLVIFLVIIFFYFVMRRTH